MEATVTIGGKTLSNHEVMAIRVTVSSEVMKLAARKRLGPLDKALLTALESVQDLLVNQ